MKKLITVFCILLGSIQSFGQICVGEPGKVKWQSWRGLFADQFSELTALEYFPEKPDITLNLYSLSAPVNYDNNFGARIAGFIKVPVSDSITFNITGDSRTRFYLSTDDNPANLVLRAFGSSFTNEFEHDKFPEQTSQKIYMNASQYYYFEMWYVESSWSDHCKLFWKTSFLSNQNWNIITAAYIYDVGCEPESCPERGLPCDDGNSLTVDDRQDGHCNCIGKPSEVNVCVGERGVAERFRYDNITGSSLNELYQAPAFPAIPDYSARMPVLGIKSESQLSNMGHLVQLYLTVPVTGLYKFNITGDDNTILFLSSDHNPENKQAHMIMVTGWTGMTEHNKYLWQSTSNLLLEAGRYYYMEINHKEGTGSEHFAAFWQTPFTQPGVWKRIPDFYVYNYACTLACIPTGTPCDDGNAMTNNDQYNSDCQCEGTPCSGPDCDSPLANYVPYEKCSMTDQLGNLPENNWLSCQISSNPNSLLPDGHWIMYDFGERHELVSAHFWNYNVVNETDMGFQIVQIDYSEDGNNWQEIGQYNWPLATGESQYGGFNGPDLSGIFARYILITSLDGTNTCRGIGKAAFKAVFCPMQGTVCDDKNPDTVNDVYTHNCECKGKNILENECEEPEVVLGDVMLYSDVYSALNTVTSVSTVDGGSKVGFIGGQYVLLDIGFETQPDAVFVASIDSCEGNGFLMPENEFQYSQFLKQKTRENQEILQIIPVYDTDLADVFFSVDQPGRTSLVLKSKEQIHYTLTDHEFINKGLYRKRIRTKRLSDGLHQLQLITPRNSKSEKLTISGGKVRQNTLGN
jgi:hypothetical protein